MRIGLASYRFINNDIEFNLSQMEKAMKSAQGRRILFNIFFLLKYKGLSC